MLLRKIDYYGQLTVCMLMFASIPVLYFYGPLLGLLILGCWQLLSAAGNTFPFLRYGRSKQICTYWRWTGFVLAALFLCIPLSRYLNPDDVQVLGAIAIISSIPLSIYYLRIYKALIDNIKMKNELRALVR